MSLLCKLAGHKVGSGYKDSAGEKYLSVRVFAIDGINRVHCGIRTECARCGETFKVGNIHLPTLDDWIADLLKKESNMSKCTQCPHVVGDAYERDCAFPDCCGGWETVYKGMIMDITVAKTGGEEWARREIERLREELAALNEKINAARGHMNLYRLFSCEGGDSYDPECAEKNLDKVMEVLK